MPVSVIAMNVAIVAARNGPVAVKVPVSVAAARVISRVGLVWLMSSGEVIVTQALQPQPGQAAGCGKAGPGIDKSDDVAGGGCGELKIDGVAGWN